MNQAEPPNPFGSVRARSTVDYVFRTAIQRHVHLSAMADQKANILIGASFVVLTLLFGQAGAQGLSPAMICLGITSMAAAFFAGLAVVPRIIRTQRRPGRQDVFFFSAQAAMDPEDYEEALAGILEEDAALYQVLARDLRSAGLVLDRKYRYVAMSYYCYFAGIPLSVVILLLT